MIIVCITIPQRLPAFNQEPIQTSTGLSFGITYGYKLLSEGGMGFNFWSSEGLTADHLFSVSHEALLYGGFAVRPSASASAATAQLQMGTTGFGT